MSTPWPPCFPFYVIFGTKLAIWTRRSLLRKKCHCKNVLRIWFSISLRNFSLIRLNLKKFLKFCPEGIIRMRYSWSATQIFSSFHKFRQINLKLGTHKKNQILSTFDSVLFFDWTMFKPIFGHFCWKNDIKREFSWWRRADRNFLQGYQI